MVCCLVLGGFETDMEGLFNLEGLGKPNSSLKVSSNLFVAASLFMDAFNMDSAHPVFVLYVFVFPYYSIDYYGHALDHELFGMIFYMGYLCLRLTQVLKSDQR